MYEMIVGSMLLLVLAICVLLVVIIYAVIRELQASLTQVCAVFLGIAFTLFACFTIGEMVIWYFPCMRL